MTSMANYRPIGDTHALCAKEAVHERISGAIESITCPTSKRQYAPRLLKIEQNNTNSREVPFQRCSDPQMKLSLEPWKLFC